MVQFASKKKVIIPSIIIAVLVSIALYEVLRERPTAVVGKIEIYRKDAEYRDQIVKIYYPQENRKMGLFQLVKGARNIEILRNHGVEFGDDMVAAEYQRMKAESKDPKMLEQIRQVFGDDEKAFYRNFVLPNLADHHIYFNFFLTDEGIQAESLKQANDFIKLVSSQNEKSFKALADEKNIKAKGLTLSLTRGMLWEAEKRMRDKNPKDLKRPQPAPVDPKVAEYLNIDTIKDAEEWYDKLIKKMNPGDVFGEPVGMGEAFVVIHYLEKVNKDDYTLEVAFFPKLDYGSWYKKESAHVKVDIRDESLIPKGLSLD